MVKNSTLLAAACLLAAAALVSADSCSPPAGVTCGSNSEYRLTSKGKSKIGTCVSCPAGQFAAPGSCCKPCNGVIFTDSTGTTSCTKCPSDSALYPQSKPQPRQPASTCMCNAGFQATGTSDITGVTGCVKCAPGTFSSTATASTSACQPCPANSIAPSSGSKACTACKNNSVPSADGQACVCPVNYYLQKAKGKAKGKAAGKPAAADEDSALSCVQCASATHNGQLNTWPVCCEANQVYNSTTKTCQVASCTDGADLINGACTCGGGIAAYSEGFCGCFDGADWASATQTCSCLNGANYTMPANPQDVPTCVCGDGAGWMGTYCDCGVGVTWDSGSKKCICPNGLQWDSSVGCCPQGKTLSDGVCV